MALAAGMAAAAPAWAEVGVLLIQTGPRGFVVWHGQGKSVLPDDDIQEIVATAQPGGGAIVPTSLGSAQAFELAAGVTPRPSSASWASP